MHTTGSGFTEWGAGLGFDLNDQSAVSGVAAAKGPFDGSGASGITFKAKGNTYIRVALPVQAVIPLADFVLDDATTDENGQLDAAQVHRVIILVDTFDADVKANGTGTVALDDIGFIAPTAPNPPAAG